jgi:hypothetical protein
LQPARAQGSGQQVEHSVALAGVEIAEAQSVSRVDTDGEVGPAVFLIAVEWKTDFGFAGVVECGQEGFGRCDGFGGGVRRGLLRLLDV